MVSRVEVKPGNAEVVHHIGLHIVEVTGRNFTGMLAMSDLYGLTTERNRLINDYVPGDLYNAKIYPSGQAIRIPKHTDLIFEVHYTPNGKADATDQSMVGFQLAEKIPDEEILTKVFRKSIGAFRFLPMPRITKLNPPITLKTTWISTPSGRIFTCAASRSCWKSSSGMRTRTLWKSGRRF